MRTEQIEKIVEHQLGEVTSGYLLLAFTPEGSAIVKAEVPDSKTALAINQLLTGIVSAGGVECGKDKQAG